MMCNFQPVKTVTSSPEEKIDLSEFTGAVVTVEFTPSNPLLPVVVSTASLIACAEIGKFKLSDFLPALLSESTFFNG